MSLRKVRIDKTAEIERLLEEYLVICLCGLPGMGRKTAVSMLLEKHPEVNPVYCYDRELRDLTALEKGKENVPNWYLIRKERIGYQPDGNEQYWEFIRNMSEGDRIFFAIDEPVRQQSLEFVWNGIMAVVMPETFRFSEAETCRYLKESKSRLSYREVQYMTGGWAGCIVMLVRLEKQLKDRWTARELCRRYEIRSYIQNEILDIIPEDERNILKERAAFPYLDSELGSLLWNGEGKDLEERLYLRGAVIYIPEKKCWFVHPVLRIAIGTYASSDLCKKAIAWYEQHGMVQEALDCCWYLQDRRLYQECLRKNYDKIPLLNYEKTERSYSSPDQPELFYIEWMEHFLHQDSEALDELREKVLRLKYSADIDDTVQKYKITEIMLNIAYTDPKISTEQWMELLKDNTEPGRPIRLYYILGESVSFLGGFRDLSALFSCDKKKKAEYRELWEERIASENQMAYRLAELEYDFQTDDPSARGGQRIDLLPDDTIDAPWQVRLGMMYLAYLFISDDDTKGLLQKYIRHLAELLAKETSPVCRWNARALSHLAEAKWGEKDGLMQWIRETGGDIENESSKTRFYMTAEVKINMYLGNYNRAEELLQLLIPYFEKNCSWRWLAEALFQRALIEYEKEQTGKALKTMAESVSVANPYRYVKIYTGYGKRGTAFLEEYREWSEKQNSSGRQGKKKYRYGSVLKMPVPDWIDYIIRKAGRQKKYYLDLQEEQQNIYRVEKLTVTEQMVMQYLERGYTNAEISQIMNIKLPTVKSHIYNIYKKLGVTTRVQAVQKAKDSGLL